MCACHIWRSIFGKKSLKTLCLGLHAAFCHCRPRTEPTLQAVGDVSRVDGAGNCPRRCLSFPVGPDPTTQFTGCTSSGGAGITGTCCRACVTGSANL
ncbi:hypothetical protein PR003_g34156 [Phytophthora rubi]|uniref:Uncharacterized protein n=1 Tax=Phytophthora rubi TaxID=129364 RepID=A0A6A4ASH5_9STRA|nr:hypothetical protein PR003_g34156 [Phytophthora rubi]